ncbi:hypothetical protein SARC_09358 [Sphaeroforma arctica JP610]|uniref:Uncharacterized protein n=1 Tax=Sphaeroforma arctica JP610 TaxID=667725 RepID=A0A0L0FP04_9EUKA|nr:hypothetical protein SARC_09358 [Sphaeroforma arctica JP610]KNC78206.1 hypothetical protein SARC_09358 [Sphaeroforma arctica JP610]|eukprot:XP_014152108.1 hypothetical protein SARC_09358 [Sphaeroforma arctica JP610]
MLSSIRGVRLTTAVQQYPRLLTSLNTMKKYSSLADTVQSESGTYPQLLITKKNVAEIKSEPAAVPTASDLKPGEVLCKVDQVALTSNNVTYAVTGAPNLFNYWGFFPSGQDDKYGMVPVWGYADVTASSNPDVAVGERLYGFYPLAGHCVLQADRITAKGFRDAAPHRQKLNAIYNQYVRSHVPTADSPVSPKKHSSTEHLNSIMRPMFTTSFLLDDFLWQCSEDAPEDTSKVNVSDAIKSARVDSQNKENNATSVGVIDTYIISSASSKTGYGTAFLMHSNRESRKGAYKIIGLTSQPNVQFVESLGIYDQVLTYDQVDQLPSKETTAIYADFSGNAKLRAKIHNYYQDNLKKDVVIGVTDFTNQGSAKGLPGARAEAFFAPSAALKRQQEWGVEGLTNKIEDNLAQFVEFSKPHVDVTVVKGEENIRKLWTDMVEWKVSPQQGFIAQF